MTLDETYERILLGIDREKRDHAIRLLKCIAFSRRPLRVEELAEILAVRFDTTIPRLYTSLRPGDAEEAVLSACSTLVTTIKLRDFDWSHDNYPYNSRLVVQFSHYSVKEFLTSGRLAESDKRDLSQYYISPERAHTILAQSCISTLLRLDIRFRDIEKFFPLAEYAAQNWFHHAQCDDVACRIQDGMVHLFDPDKKHFSLWISIYDVDNPDYGTSAFTKTKASPLYYAALCGITSLVEDLIITRQQDPNKSRGKQGTPLHVAVASGHTTIVRLLLDHTANVNARGMHTSTPLCVAVRSGHLDIAQLLLSHGANINSLNSRDIFGNTLLHEAVRSRKLDVTEFLLKVDVDVNVRNRDNWTPLHEAADMGDFDIVRLLFNNGADSNIVDRRGDSPLHRAVRYQKHDTVELLVKIGADVNVRSVDDQTPLHEAVRGGNLNIIKILLSHGANVNALDYFGDSPLHKALQSKKNHIVGEPFHTSQQATAQLLLEHGADVNVRGWGHGTPLHLASLGGFLDVSRLLIEHGADIDAQDDDGQTPFSIALANGHRKLAHLLSNDRVPPEHDA